MYTSQFSHGEPTMRPWRRLSLRPGVSRAGTGGGGPGDEVSDDG
jgi:hypothetical protein